MCRKLHQQLLAVASEEKPPIVILNVLVIEVNDANDYHDGDAVLLMMKMMPMMIVMMVLLLMMLMIRNTMRILASLCHHQCFWLS